jgi:hypothetical protein
MQQELIVAYPVFGNELSVICIETEANRGKEAVSQS